MRKISFLFILMLGVTVSSQTVFAESWFSKTFGDGAPIYKLFTASVFDLTTVSKIQTQLINTGMLQGTVTGVVDQKTIDAVKAYQLANGLRVDGIVGPQTLSALNPSLVSNLISSGSATLAPVDTWKLKCLALTGTTPTPQIEVISPNGGEVFTPGQQITVRWRTCNIPANSNIAVRIVYQNPQGGTVVKASSINDGQEVLTIPNQNSFFVSNQMQFGKLYKVYVSEMRSSGPGVEDGSNSLFSINYSAINPFPVSTTPISITSTPFSITTTPISVSSTPISVSSTPIVAPWNPTQTGSPVLIRPLDNESSLVNFSKNALFNHLFSLKNTSNKTIWINCFYVMASPKITGTMYGGRGDSHCTSNHPKGFNIGVWVELYPNQEVIMNRSELFTPGFKTGTVSSEIQTIFYRISPIGPDIIVEPRDNVQFDPSWNLETPQITFY